MIVLRVSHTVSRWSYDRNNSYITKANCIINTKVKNKVQKEGANATSSRVIVNSPIGRWKLLVSLCYLSAKADKSPLSRISNEHIVKERNPIAVTMPSILSADLSNFSTFLP